MLFASATVHSLYIKNKYICITILSRSNRDGSGDNVGPLVMILAVASLIVIVLIMVLTYLVFGRKGGFVSNKFTVLDDQGRP